MDLAFISPTTHLENISGRGTILLALAHLVDDAGKNEYTRWHRRRADKGWRILLDNGLFEGTQIDGATLLHRAELIGAQVVCAPDVLYNSSETIKAFKQFIKAKQDKGMVIDVMGVPQANNPTEWWECFRFMDLSNDCKLIGLSILSVPHAFNEYFGITGITTARMRVIQQLYNYEILLGRRLTSCHLLGLGEHLGDITLATRLLPNTITSNDSSSVYVHGRKRIRYGGLGNIPGGKDHEAVNFAIDENLSEDQLADIYWNMGIAHMLAKTRT